MNYVNPVSIAQMSQRPQDTNFPGAGLGLSQGYLEGKALNQANDFLDLSKAQAAQEYVGNQWKMQTAHDQYPLEKEKLSLGNETARQGIQTSKLNNRLSQEKIDMLHQSGAINKIAFVGSLAPALQQAASDPLRMQAILKQGQQHYAQMFPGDTEGLKGFEWDGNPQTLKEKIDAALLAADIAREADAGFQQKKSLLGSELDFRGTESAANRKTTEKVASGHDQTSLEVARIRAAADKATQSGGNAWSAIRADIAKELIDAAAKLDSLGEAGWAKLTPRERAVLTEGPKIVAGGYASAELKTEPSRIGAGAREKAKGEMSGTMEAIDELRAPPKPQTPTQPAAPAQPQQSQPQNENPEHSPALRQMLQQRGLDYDPNKYEYFKDHVGTWFVRPK